MKKFGVFGLVLILIMVLSTVSPAWAISDSWTKVKPYGDKTYNDEIGNSTVGDWGGISIGVSVVKYVDWGSGVNYDTLLVRIALDVALKDGYRDRTFWPFYFVKWVKLEFLETLSPDYTAIESHDLSGYNLKVQEDVELPEAEAAVTIATTLIGLAHPALGMLLAPIEIAAALGKVVPTEETKDDAERYDEGAQIVWLNPGLSATGDPGVWADWSIDEATGYCEVYWQVYDGAPYHKIQLKATVSFSEMSTMWETWEEVETSVTLELKPGYLTIDAATGGTTDPSPGTYVYDEETTVEVTAIPDSGYTFDYWVLDGATKYDNPITVTMNSDHDLTAYFEEESGGGGGGGSGGGGALITPDSTNNQK